jgi:hypothetical protein
MYERTKKPTLEQIETLFPFHVKTIADQAGVLTDTLYHALALHPISKQNAQKIITALSQHIGLPLSLEQVDMAIWEDCDVLWLMRASAHGGPPEHHEQKDRFYDTLYARDWAHAAALVRQWFEHDSPVPSASFTERPHGFKIIVSGRQYIEASQAMSKALKEIDNEQS